MFRLDATDEVLQIVVSANADVIVSGSDKTATAYTGFSQETAATTGAAREICAAPGASTVRDIDHINIKNTNAGANTVTVQKYKTAGTVTTTITYAVLAQNDTLEYTHANGWHTLDSNGSAKFSINNVIGNLTVGGTLGVTGAITGGGYSGGAISGTTGGFSDLLTVTRTVEQLRLAYDGTRYVSFTVTNTGALTIAPTGTNPGISFTPGGTGYTTTTRPFLIDVAAKPNFVMNSAGTNYGYMQNDSADTWSLATGTDINALGTPALTWTKALAVTIPGTLALTATATPTGTGAGAVGQIAWDTSYFYICTATNDWRRVALTDF